MRYPGNIDEQIMVLFRVVRKERAEKDPWLSEQLSAMCTLRSELLDAAVTAILLARQEPDVTKKKRKGGVSCAGKALRVERQRH